MQAIRLSALWRIAFVTLCLGLLLGASSVSAFAQNAPPAYVRNAVDAVVGFIRGESDDSNAFIANAMAPDQGRDNAALADRLSRLRAAAPDDVAEIEVRPTSDGVEVALSGPGGRLRLALTVDEAGLHDVREAGERAALRLPPPPIEDAQTATEMRQALTDWLSALAARDAFSGAVLVARGGAPFVSVAVGMADREGRVLASVETPSNIASIGKKFTQAALASLLQTGRIHLGDQLGTFIPDYPNVEARSATIAQLVEHRGGVADFFGPEFDRAHKDAFRSNHDYYEFVSHLPQRFTPGEREEYCNGCYVVLGEIIERVSGVPFETYVRQNVFEPAGMRATTYRLDEGNAAATPYTRVAESRLTDASAMHGVAGSGAGGAFSTVSDLMAFDNALREGRLLDARWSGWVLGGGDMAGARNVTPLAIAGGAPGVNSVAMSGGEWGVFAIANLDPPAAGDVADSIMSALGGAQ
ncbi:MAG: beta-lactamase family protein [Hyphomonadaceae bacterium]|nr:beta-lactamase family protein [Hyphomonadaceae bacterium]